MRYHLDVMKLDYLVFLLCIIQQTRIYQGSFLLYYQEDDDICYLQNANLKW